MLCHSDSSNSKKFQNKGGITIALAGNANVGKSVLFNQLTGSSQIIGNWPGKTVERALGSLNFEGQQITVVDLPGIYSFSTFGMEETVSREYVALYNSQLTQMKDPLSGKIRPVPSPLRLRSGNGIGNRSLSGTDGP